MMKIDNLVRVALVVLLVFGYSSFQEIRILPFVVALLFLVLIIKYGISIRGTPELGIASIIVSYAIVISLFGGEFDIAASVVIFFVLAYMPDLINLNKNINLNNAVIDSYIVSAVILSLMIFSQALLLSYGVEWGKIDFMGGSRIGLGATWSDYSFLSLFLVSSLPLVFRHRFFLIPIFVLGASVVTSARTGIAALLICFAMYLFYRVILTLINLKINKEVFRLLIYCFIFSVAVFAFYKAFSHRDFNLDGSGRLEGYLYGWNYFLENPIFGSMLSVSAFKGYYPVIPHNFFVYLVSMGGLVFLLMVLTWVFLLLHRVLIDKTRMKLFYSLCIVFIGFQFIPSFYSAYFCAVLIMLSKVKTSKEMHLGVPRI